MFYPLTVITLLFLPTALHAMTSCIDPTQLQPPEFPSPPYSDCLHIFTHLPFPPTSSTPNLHSHLHSDFNLHSPSSPFFPTAIFAFDSCYVQISYHTGAPLPQPFLYQTLRNNLQAQRRSVTPGQALSEASVRKLWAKAKAGLGRIVDECVDKGEIGLDWDSVELEEMEWTWYAVEVFGRGGEGVDREGPDRDDGFKSELFEFGGDHELFLGW